MKQFSFAASTWNCHYSNTLVPQPADLVAFTPPPRLRLGLAGKELANTRADSQPLRQTVSYGGLFPASHHAEVC